jgi:hypothetical protein
MAALYKYVSMDTIYIYALLDLSGTPFYVGKTHCLKQRKRGHKGKANTGFVSPLYNKIRKLQSRGWVLEFQILEICDILTWEERERFYIKHFRDMGLRMVNVTDGGENGCSSETAKKGVETRRKNGTLAHTEETKRKLSQAHIGVPKSDSHKESLRKAWKRTPEQLKESSSKASKTSKGKINIKQYVCTSPDGKEYITTEGLKKFCEEQELTHPNMIKVANGQRPQHKGWTCLRIPQIK